MGCKGSKVQVVEPGDGRKSGWGAQGKVRPDNQAEDKSQINTSSGRDGSAMSKGTMDSGLGHEEEITREILPGTVTEKPTSPRRINALNNDQSLLTSRSQHERQASSDILEELITQGIIQSKTKTVKNGEAYDVMVETSGKPLRRPPAKLEKLKTSKKKNTSLTKEDIESKMKAAEERRKTKEEELKKRLRSDRPMTAFRSITELRGEGSFTPDEDQEPAATVPNETLDSAASENVMSRTTLSQGVDEQVDEIIPVESDITYNNPGDQEVDSGNDIF
ncbi:stathmin domain-containing protein 1 [Spea bombifrons]|uniref:stathmin domain-containing protein 1 n=1 Tax=Spea bombifrons TaxID=233779 RepID=UPI00234B01CA|nr:stathmin domain-containing protein 1 [Spea bombifrons]